MMRAVVFVVLLALAGPAAAMSAEEMCAAAGWPTTDADYGQCLAMARKLNNQDRWAKIGRAGQALSDYSARRAAEPDPAPSMAATLGTYETERDNGGNKVCVYNKFGQSSVITVPLVSACPR